jgi:hypothetical protein
LLSFLLLAYTLHRTGSIVFGGRGIWAQEKLGRWTLPEEHQLAGRNVSTLRAQGKSVQEVKSSAEAKAGGFPR